MGNQNLIANKNENIDENYEKNNLYINTNQTKYINTGYNIQNEFDNEQNFDDLPNNKSNHLNKYRKISGLCLKHLITPHFYYIKKLFSFNELHDEINQDDLLNNNPRHDKDNYPPSSKTNFLNPRMLECLHNYKEYINNYLKTSFNDYFESNSLNANIYDDLFEFELNIEGKLNLLGNINTNFYVNGFHEIFIEFAFDLPEWEQSTFGIKLLRKGAVSIGRFNEEGLLQGDGLYINKKGDLFVGDYVDNEMTKAIIYCYKGQTYEGTIKNFKKHGISQTENTPIYEFIGDFENGKKLQGVYYPKNEDVNGVKIKSIEINRENLDILKINIKEKDTKNFLTKITYDNNGKNLIYTGNVCDNQFNDTNAILQFNPENKFPLFYGSIVDNIKDGKCKYYRSENDFYTGVFINNKFFSDIEIEANENKTHKTKNTRVSNINYQNQPKELKSQKTIVSEVRNDFKSLKFN